MKKGFKFCTAVVLAAASFAISSCAVSVVLNEDKLQQSVDGSGDISETSGYSEEEAEQTVTLQGEYEPPKEDVINTELGEEWTARLDEYREDSSVEQVIFVMHTDSSHANLGFYVKEDGVWVEKIYTPAYLGESGIDKVKAGDMKTPTGTFTITGAFGLKDDPGSLLPYVKVTDTMYWCSGNDGFYNQFIDVSVPGYEHDCSGEHLIDYDPYYNYALYFDFNSDNVVGAGAGIFLHCWKESKDWTHGCIAIPEEYMIEILRNTQVGAKICIYEE